MDATQLSAIRARVDAATAGPWGAYSAVDDAAGDLWPWGVYVDDDSGAEIVDAKADHGIGQDRGIARQADAEFVSHARTDVPALLAEVERLQAREVHFARVLRVPDGGEYLNDWDSRLTGLLDEVERLHTALAAAGDFMDPGTRRLWLAALRTDPEEDA